MFDFLKRTIINSKIPEGRLEEFVKEAGSYEAVLHTSEQLYKDSKISAIQRAWMVDRAQKEYPIITIHGYNLSSLIEAEAKRLSAIINSDASLKNIDWKLSAEHEDICTKYIINVLEGLAIEPNVSKQVKSILKQAVLDIVKYKEENVSS